MVSEKQLLHLRRIGKLPRTEKERLRLGKLAKERHPNAKAIKDCETCKNPFEYYKSMRPDAKYCSMVCKNSSPKMKEISRQNGKKNGKKYLGNKNPNWKGGKSYFLNNIRTMDKMRLWVYDIFKRDKFTCQKCGDNKGGNLNAHHIKHLAEIVKENIIKSVADAYKCDKLWDIDNGITLCIKCHRKEHNHYIRGHR